MNYFVTGGTGFIGRFLIARLLERGGTVYVLTRKNSLPRLDTLRKHWGASDQQVVAVTGDLKKPKLGVSSKQIKELAGQIDHFFHLAAIYDMEADAESQQVANVQGTTQAIALSKALKAGCYHHVSSIAAAGLYPGTFTEDMFEEAKHLDHPYFATKHESEGLVRKEKRMSWRIYRPGIVVGHSETGEIDKIDGPYYFFEAVKKFGDMAPEWLPVLTSKAGFLNLVPVDYVVAAMDYLAHLPEHDKECFFLTEPEGIRVGEVLQALMKQAHGPKLVPLDIPLLDRASQWLGTGLDMFSPVKKITDQLLGKLGIPPSVMEELTYPTKFDSTKTRLLLEPAGLQCPQFEDYLGVLWKYWEEHLRTDSENGADSSTASSLLSEAGQKVRNLIGNGSVSELEQEVMGKVVVVTGATSGIGKACALKLAKAGAIVVLVARTVEKLDETLAEIKRIGGQAYAYPCDVSSMEDCDRLVKQVLDEHRRVDVLINNAGRSIRRSVCYSYDRFHDFERTMQLNYFGALRLIMGFLPVMEEQSGGHIVNISSIGVLTSPPRFSAYVASKAALDAFSVCAAPEFTDKNIHFTSIYMPLVRTPMIAPTSLYNAFPTLSPDEARDLVMKALVEKPRRLASGFGVAGAVAQATMPGVTESVLNQAYHLFPDSAAARGLSDEEAEKEKDEVPSTKLELARKLFAQVMKGGHW